jgi:FKBP-type peptidyl-prolyl cis-trans isomerase FklB
MKSLKKIAVILIVITFMLNLHSYSQENAAGTSLKTDNDTLSYSFGLLIGNNMLLQGVQHINQDLFLKGLQHGLGQDSAWLRFEEANIFLQRYFEKQVKAQGQKNLEAGKAFLEENKKKDGVVTLPSGLQYKVLVPGEGNSPLPGDKVTVHYTGKLIDGTIFDSSIERNEPATFQVDQVIKGWTEALQLMKPGAKWILYIPPDLAYGDNGAGDVIGPDETLIFEVELLSIEGK